MVSLYDQLVQILGEPPTDLIAYFYYLLAGFIVFLSIKLLFTMIFKFILNVRI